MENTRPGISFEKAVALVQAQLDPTSGVTHNEIIIDRLGQSRQFDVVIRGSFAGQPILGVVECKDHRRKTGTPEIDAFVTKALDVNANVRIFMSRRGFTKPALQKCAHYGIQPLSLLSHDYKDIRLFLGIRWEAERSRWNRLSITLKFVNEPSTPVILNAETLTIGGKRVLDWFTNYLLTHEYKNKEFGWVVG